MIKPASLLPLCCHPQVSKLQYLNVTENCIKLNQSGHFGQFNSFWATTETIFDTKDYYSFYFLCFYWKDLRSYSAAPTCFLPAVKQVFPLTCKHLWDFTLSPPVFFWDITLSHILIYCISVQLKVSPLRITCSPFKYDKGASLNHFINRFTVLGYVNRLLFSVCGPQGADLYCTIRCPERENTGQWSDLNQNVVMMHSFPHN